MAELLKLIQDLNLHQMVPIIFAIWYFTRNIQKELHADMAAIRADMRADNAAIQKEFKFINIRLSRVEGTMYGKDIYKVDKDE